MATRGPGRSPSGSAPPPTLPIPGSMLTSARSPTRLRIASASEAADSASSDWDLVIMVSVGMVAAGPSGLVYSSESGFETCKSKLVHS